MESFRGGGGEAIGGRTGGSAYTETDPAPLGFTGTTGSCADRSGLYCLLIDIIKFILFAATLTVVTVFAFSLAAGGSVTQGLNSVRRIFGN